MEKELIFVYNIHSPQHAQGVSLSATEPGRSSCALCRLIYNSHDLKDEWKHFLDTIPYKKSFLYKDEFSGSYPTVHPEFPAIFIRSRDGLRELVSSQEIADAASMAQLRQVLRSRLGV
jgi:hypothetical protein